MMESAQPFGRYILMDCVAVGGMAEIFLAKTVGSDGREQQLAIKRILPSYSEDEGFVTMFKDEAVIARQLDHPNIVKVYDFGQVGNEHFIAMEFIHGADLKRLVEVAEKNTKRFTPTQVAFVLAEVAKALDYAHKRTAADHSPLNIVHRDVTPHNIMLTYQGEVKLMDFGIAKAASRATKTRAGTVKGKCSYMSPEQARGKPLDGRSDMFSLGIIGWEMLTGKRLFTGSSDFDILSKVLKSEIQSPRSLDGNVPEELARIVLKALERDRDRRYVDCGEMLGDLNQFLFQAADAQNHRLGLWTMALASHDGHIPAELPNYTSSVDEEEEDVSQEKTQMLSITEMEEKLGLSDGDTDGDVQDAAKTIPLDGAQVSAFLEQQNLLQSQGQPGATVPLSPVQPGMQPGMMQPGMQGMMQPGMQGMMQPGMQGMMQPGMQGMMQPGMQPGMMQPGMMPYGYAGQMTPYGAPPPQKGNTGLIIAIVLVLLLIVAGAGGAYYFLKLRTPAAPPAVEAVESAPPAADTPISYLTFKTIPSGATVTINGEPLPTPTPIFGYTANLGDKLVISFELENYERKTIERSVIKQSQVIEEELSALGTPPLLAQNNPTTNPTDPTTNPTDPTTNPTDPTTNPTDPTTNPTDPTTNPTDPTTNPTDPTTNPTDPTTNPTDPTTNPTDPTTNPTDPVTNPTDPSATATGSLRIESEPSGSRVRIDANNISGTTPLTVEDLPLGVEMEIVISPKDKDYSRVIRSKYKLEKEGETLLSVKHKKAEEKVDTSGTATISVSATPWGQVYLDGKRLGNTPIKDKEISSGKHKLEIAFPPKSKRVSKSIKLKNGASESYGYDFNSDSWK
ncbi:MAG: protein kinase [Myxococcota bacterium]|jgi:serine/threonine protein kinase|nr:protein kinase [Myxococcota bacterium]